MSAVGVGVGVGVGVDLEEWVGLSLDVPCDRTSVVCPEKAVLRVTWSDQHGKGCPVRNYCLGCFDSFLTSKDGKALPHRVIRIIGCCPKGIQWTQGHTVVSVCGL